MIVIVNGSLGAGKTEVSWKMKPSWSGESARVRQVTRIGWHGN